MNILPRDQGPRAAAPRRAEQGMVTVIFIALLAIMMILLMVENSSIIRLHREVKLLEQRQARQISAIPTNAIPFAAKP